MNQDKLEQLDLLQKLCNRKHQTGAILSVDEDGFFSAQFPDGSTGYYYSFDHAVSSINNKK
jgi:hypothetical protein